MTFGSAESERNTYREILTYVITIHQRHKQTDGQTDGQTTCDRKTALCTVVHRAVKNESNKAFAESSLQVPGLPGNPGYRFCEYQYHIPAIYEAGIGIGI